MKSMRRRVEQEIQTNQWEVAERTITELLKVGPETDQLKGWKKTIADGREAAG